MVLRNRPCRLRRILILGTGDATTAGGGVATGTDGPPETAVGEVGVATWLLGYGVGLRAAHASR